MFNGSMEMNGALRVRKIGARKAPLAWRIKNAMRWGFITGWFFVRLAKLFSKLTGIVTITSELALRKRLANGEWIDYGVVGYKVITDAGVAFLVDDFDGGATEISNMKYHGVGTGGTAEAVGDTALVTESTTALNPDSTRATGTGSQPSANIYRSTGTLTFDNTAAITEHGLFSQAAVPGGVLWDRTLFSVVNMASGESLQTQYSVTFNSGG